MLYEHTDPSFLIRHARFLIGKAKATEDQRSRDDLLTEASRITAEAERLIKGKRPVVIYAEAAE
jgi:hypothetical protein